MVELFEILLLPKDLCVMRRSCIARLFFFCSVEQLSSLAYSAAAYHPPPTPYPVSGTMHHLPPLPRYPGSASRLPTPLLAATPPLDRVTSIG